MPEGQSGRFEKPSSGELQARAAEKIIQDAQRRERQPSLGNEGTARASTPVTPQEHSDTAKLEATRNTFKQLDEWKHRVLRKKDGGPSGKSATDAEVDRVFAEIKKNSAENIERQRLEAVAKMNATKRLPWKDRLYLLITGSVLDSEIADELLEEERMKLGLHLETRHSPPPEMPHEKR